MTLLERLRHYYKTNGINENWIGPKYGEGHLKLFPLQILPKAFRNWMKIHDAHHLITGFETSFRGEVEIAAWVLARNGLNFGSKPRWLPFFVIGDTLFLALIGLFLCPKQCYGPSTKVKTNTVYIASIQIRFYKWSLAANRYVATGSFSKQTDKTQYSSGA